MQSVFRRTRVLLRNDPATFKQRSGSKALNRFWLRPKRRPLFMYHIWRILHYGEMPSLRMSFFENKDAAWVSSYREVAGIHTEPGKLVELLEFLVEGGQLRKESADHILRCYFTRKDAAQARVGHTKFVGRSSAEGLVIAYASFTNAPIIHKIEIDEKVNKLPEYVKETMIQSAVANAILKARRVMYDEYKQIHEDCMTKLYEALSRDADDEQATRDNLNPFLDSQSRDLIVQIDMFPERLLDERRQAIIDEYDEKHQNPLLGSEVRDKLRSSFRRKYGPDVAPEDFVW